MLPFNLVEAQRCGELNATYYRNLSGEGKRDAVKDDFKIIAQTVEQQARLLITEDEETLARYCDRLRNDGKISFKTVPLRKEYNETLVNNDGQGKLDIDA